MKLIVGRVHTAIFAWEGFWVVGMKAIWRIKEAPLLKNHWLIDWYFADDIFCRKLSRRVAGLIALALNLDQTYFDKPGLLDDPMAALRLLHYSG